MVILSAATLNDIEDIFNLDRLEVSNVKITTKINWLKNIYSERLYKLVEIMMRTDERKREDFFYLEEIL